MQWLGTATGAPIRRKMLTVLLTTVAGCTSKIQPDEALRHEAETLHKITVPSGTTNCSSSGIERVNAMVRVSWEFETMQAWEDYERHVSDGLRREGFTGSAEAQGRLDFVKQLPGDTHAIRVELLRPRPPLLIRATFRAWAS